jgi:hypothetical protein
MLRFAMFVESTVLAHVSSTLSIGRRFAGESFRGAFLPFSNLESL